MNKGFEYATRIAENARYFLQWFLCNYLIDLCKPISGQDSPEP